MKGDRAGSGSDSSSDSSRRTTTSRSGARKRARNSARGRSSGGVQEPLFFPVFPVSRKGGGVSAGVKSVLGAWLSRGRLAAAIAAAALAAASAQEGGGGSVADTAESVLVPLASAGLQYTADVTITNSSAVRGNLLSAPLQ